MYLVLVRDVMLAANAVQSQRKKTEDTSISGNTIEQETEKNVLIRKRHNRVLTDLFRMNGKYGYLTLWVLSFSIM